MEKLTQFRREWLSDAETIVAHTSGSTGTPKEIHLRKSDMIHSARATNLHFGISECSVLACPLSIDYIAGKMMAVRAWIAGARFLPLEISNRFDLPAELHIDLLAVVPSMIPNLLAHPEWSARVANVLIGGAAPAPSALKALAEAGYRYQVSYGMTETCSHVALAGADGIFRAMPGVSFGLDSRGCLIIYAPGYSWKSLTTNDAVQLLDESSFIWKGRIDGVINTGGIKLFPEELERLYEPVLPGVEFAVTSRLSGAWGREVVLVTTSDSTQVRDALTRSDIPHHKLPKHIIAVDTLPLTRTGKPDRAALASLATESPSS